MTKTKLSFLLIGIALAITTIASASAAAKDVAYILEDGSSISGNVVITLNQLGLTYDIIRDSQIPSTNFDNYYVLLVTENVGNKDLLPFEQKHAIFLDRKIAEEVWPTADSSFTTNARQIKVSYPTHQIFTGLTLPPDGIIDVYGGSGYETHYLNKKPSTVTSLAIRTAENKPIVAFSVRSINGYLVRDVFFGLIDSNHWNTNAQTIFKNALVFLRADVDQDQDGFAFEVDCNDLNPAIYPGAPEIPYDSIDQDCNGFDLLDVDTDGYCNEGYLIQNSVVQCIYDTGLTGTDCADNNPVINPAYPNKSLNCINDAPEFITVPQNLVFSEGELVKFQVTAADPEGDNLVYSINNPHFIVNKNNFSWQTGYEDAGLYILNVNVTDGEYSAEAITTLRIADANAPPLSIPIPPITWAEETEAYLNLSEYFTDQDSDDLEFGVETYPNHTDIDVEFDSSEIVRFTSEVDYFGEDTIVFYAYDGHTKTLSNTAELVVTNVNDPLFFNGTIPDIAFNEDQPLVNAIDLNDYFIDSDSVLNFEVHDNHNMTIEITDGKVSFYPEKDYNGVQQIYFNASDEEFTVGSNVFTVTVYEQGEPPEISPLNCTTSLNEDTGYNCTLSATDFENDTITFSVSHENNLQCDIVGDILTYKSAPDYYGSASCTIRASDIDGYSEKVLNVTINPINDAPRIGSFTPATETVHVVEGWNQTFTINAYDIDSPEIWTTWYQDSFEVRNSTENASSYTLINPAIGNYLVEAIVRDTQLQTRQFWNVVVGPIEDFTCSEVGGHICSDKKICEAETLGVKDTKSCCPVDCIPSFKDANSCGAISDKIVISISDFENSIELGSTIKVEFTVENEMDSDQKFDIETHLYNLDSDRSEESIETTVEVGEGRSRVVRLDLKIPEDLNIEDDEFAIFVKAEDDSCGQNYKKISLVRPKDILKIASFDLPANAYCGETITSEVEVENIGSNDNQATLTIKSTDLQISGEAAIDLEKYGGEDTEKKEFIFEIPGDIDSGEYEVTARIDYGDNKFEKIAKTLSIECTKEQVRSNTQIPSTIDEKITLNQLEETIQQSKEEKPNYLPLAVLGTMNVLLIGSALILYQVYKRKHLSSF